MRKILVVEDDFKIGRLIKETLAETEFDIRISRSAEESLKELKTFFPDLLILDVRLPGMDGFQLCEKMKKSDQWKKIPILMLSGEAIAVEDRVTGLDIGADDYMIKPFAPDELQARVRSLLRRSLDEGDSARILRAGEIVIDLSRRTVTSNKQAIELTPKEFDLLVELMKEQGRVMSRAVLLRKVWGYKVEISSRTVDMHISSLRTKLGRAGNYLKTEESLGYCFQL